jgi:hypothetical protein
MLDGPAAAPTEVAGADMHRGAIDHLLRAVNMERMNERAVDGVLEALRQVEPAFHREFMERRALRERPIDRRVLRRELLRTRINRGGEEHADDRRRALLQRVDGGEDIADVDEMDDLSINSFPMVQEDAGEDDDAMDAELWR